MDQLALSGGNPVRTKPFPSWPPTDDALVDAVADVVRSGVWGDVGGAQKLAFERRFAEHQQARHATGVCNGTIALQLALAALGVRRGDEVIVPAYTFLATATAVLTVNALPVFVDIDPETTNIDPAVVEAAITPRTRAIIPVHFGGQPADLDRLTEIARRHDVALVEDCAHAHGAIWKGRPVGAIGDVGCWSFQQSKNLTSGEGGAVTTNSAELAELLWSLHHCGRTRGGVWYDHTTLGGNYRITDLQAALLLGQLDRLNEQLDRRERSAAILDRGLAAIPGVRPLIRDPRCTRHAYHIHQFRYDEAEMGGLPRDRFIAAMAAEGIPLSGGYPMPLNRQTVFAKAVFDHGATNYDASYGPTKYGELDLPDTEDVCRHILWITQNVLLADDSDLTDVLTAAEKVRRNADALRRNGNP